MWRLSGNRDADRAGRTAHDPETDENADRDMTQKNPAPRPCNFHATAGAGAVTQQRAQHLFQVVTSLPPDARIAALRDLRPIHHALFDGLAPPEWPDAAGTWRGTPGSSLATAPRAVFLARRLPGLRFRDLCLPAEAVPDAMATLAEALQKLWDDAPGRTDPWRDDAFVALAAVTARFFAIHPFMDGNGHVWRLALPVLAARLGLSTRPDWTIHRRPYGPTFSLALQWYADHPTVLADHLRRWFHPADTASAHRQNIGQPSASSA